MYTGSISVTATETIQAIAVASGLSQNAVASSVYTIVPLGPAPALISASPNTGMQSQLNLPVVLTGTNFLPGPVCSFGPGITVNSCTYNSATLITAHISIAANATVGTNTISIIDTDGQIATLPGGFSIALNTNPFSPILVNAGGLCYTDSQTQVWSADKNFSGGSTASSTHSIANTADPKLYQTERYGNFTYQFTVPNGTYNVVLKFAEFYWTSVGKRIFNVAINGTPVLTNFDIIAAVGTPYTAIDKTFATMTSTGTVAIQFTSGSADLPKISAIEISSASGVLVQVSPTPVSLYASQQQQFTSSVAGNANNGCHLDLQSSSWHTNSQWPIYRPSFRNNSSSCFCDRYQPGGQHQVGNCHCQSSAASRFVYSDFCPFRWQRLHRLPGEQLERGHRLYRRTGCIHHEGHRQHARSRSLPDRAYGNSAYQFTVPPGKYTVILKFAEIYWTTTGRRLFNTSINGT